MTDDSFSLSFLRTTAERKPRTECACQPVSFISMGTVAPLFRPKREIARACLETLVEPEDRNLAFLVPVDTRERFARVAFASSFFMGAGCVVDFWGLILLSGDCDSVGCHHLKPAIEEVRAELKESL